MKNSKLWFREIMSIKIPNLIHKDLTKILFLFYLIKSKKFNYNYKISDFNSYVYRFYSDNHELAKLHPSIIVNSINHYGTKELLPFTIQMLEEWKKDFPNGCLTYNETHFKVEIEDFSDDVLEFTENIADMLYQKATNMHYTYSEELEELNEISEYKLDLINLTRLKNRVFENIQYCCCCDSCDDLYIINISEDLDKINQISNYITVCKKHYELYKLGYFSFKETGKINIIKIHPDLNPSMRISSVVLKNMKNINLSYGIEAIEKINKETYVEIAKKIIKAYEKADFTNLYPLFSEDMVWSSQWVIPDRKGKEEIINYYDEKSRQIKNSDSEIKGLVIETVEQRPFVANPNVPQPQVMLYTPVGKICTIIGQKVDGKENHMVLTFELNHKLQITNISIADPSFYTFKVYEEE